MEWLVVIVACWLLWGSIRDSEDSFKPSPPPPQPPPKSPPKSQADIPYDIKGYGKVIDGDGIWVAGVEIRLWGIDAPEYNQTATHNGATVEWGKKAKQRLARKIYGKQVCCSFRGIDRYQRTLAICYITENHQPLSLNGWLVRNGLALAYVQFGGKVYKALEQKAKEQQRGCWGYDNFIAPWLWRQASP